MKCFYHSADLDGQCSGAIIKHFLPDCELIGINYGQPFPWADIKKEEEVYMVDFSLQPFSDMIRLADRASLIWIDHHRTAMQDAAAAGIDVVGIRREGIGACVLTWQWFQAINSGTANQIGPVPLAVQLLGEYDVWNHSDPRTLPFQYGIRLEDTRPENYLLWSSLFRNVKGQAERVVEAGHTVLRYEDQSNAKFCKAYAFPTELRVPIGVLGSTYGVPAICANRGFTNSRLFSSVWDQDKYDLMITFSRLPLPAEKWTVSLYSDKVEVDCGEIAKAYGGGGHEGAAGFQCDDLPFKY